MSKADSTEHVGIKIAASAAFEKLLPHFAPGTPRSAYLERETARLRRGIEKIRFELVRLRPQDSSYPVYGMSRDLLAGEDIA